MIIYPDQDMHCWEVASGMIIADADNFYTKAQTERLITEEVQEVVSDNCYTKSETDSIVSDLETADSAISGAVDNVSSAVSQEAQRAQDAEGGLSSLISAEETRAIAAEGELANQIATKADSNSVYTKSETDSLLDAKLDVSAYTPTDLSNYYTKVETNNEINAAVSGKADSSAVTQEISAAVSGKADSSAVTQEISAAVSGKQDTLIAGTNITISGNVISASSGGSGVTPEEVEEMIDSAVSGQEISAAVSGKADSSAVTEAISSAVSGKADSSAVTQEISAAVSGKQDALSAGSGVTISGNVVSTKIWSGTKAQWSQISGNTQADMLYLVYE